MKRRHARLILWGGILGGVFAVSIVMYMFIGSSQINRVLYFPEEGSLELHGEMRRLPRRRGDEGNIELIVNELILGPLELSLNPLLPKHTSVRSCLFRDRKVYLDLSSELIVQAGETGLSVDESLLGVERTIRFNFPRVEEVIFFIDGEMYHPEGFIADM